MALSIKNVEVERLARELAAATGETVTEAIRVALDERLRRRRGRVAARPLCDELAVIRLRCSRLPVLDTRPVNEILGYDERGLPG